MKLLAKKLTPSEIEEIISAKLKWILSYSQPLKIILFGSAATNQMTEASDVDLIAIYSDISDIKKIGFDLEKNRSKDDWPHDLLLLTESEFQFYVSKGGGACWIASQEGRVLYKKNGVI